MNPRKHFPFVILFAGLVCIICCFTTPARAEVGESWTNITFDKDIRVLKFQGDTLWAGTWGGLLKWDLTAGTYTKYTIADGLADNMINDIAFDNLGQVWVATDMGLSMFNGSTWTTYDKTNSGIPGEAIYYLAVTSENKVWLHSRDVNGSLGMGLTMKDGSTWATFNTSNSQIPDNDLRAIAADNIDQLWVGTNYGDVGVYSTSWITHTNINNNHSAITSIAVDSMNRKWFVSLYADSTYKIRKYDGVSWTSLIPSEACTGYLHRLSFGAGDKAWLTSNGVGLCAYDGTWSHYDTSNSELLHNSPVPIAAKGTKAYIGYDLFADGFSEFDGTAWQHYDTVDFLPDNVYYKGYAVNRETWFGANPGAYKYDGNSWTAYTSANSELSDTYYMTIAADHSNHLWFAGGDYAGGLVEYDHVNTWTQHFGFGVPDQMVYSIAVGADNRVWAGHRMGISVYDRSSWTTYNIGKIEYIAIDGIGNVWVNGPTRYNGSSWYTYASIEEAIQDNFDAIVDTLPTGNPKWVADTDNNRVWVGKGLEGVAYYDGVSWTTFSNTILGHPSWGWWANIMPRDRAGNVWAQVLRQTYFWGSVSRFDGTSWHNYFRSDGVIEPPGQMTVVHNGDVWFSDTKGFSVYSNPYQPIKKTLWTTKDMSLLSIDGSTTVDVPASAVDQPTTLIYTTTMPFATGDLLGIGHFFAMSAVISGTTTPVTSFNQPYTVTVEYTDEESAGVDESTLSLYWWDGSEWQQATSTCDPIDNRVIATLDHLTKFAVLGEEPRLYLPLVMR